jgi:hypothetical protein
MAHRLRSLAAMRIGLSCLVGVAALAVGCAGSSGAGDGETGEHHYTLDTSHYYGPNEPSSLRTANENLLLPLEAKSATLTEAMPGSLDKVYTRRYCDAGENPSEFGNWERVQQPRDVAAVHLTKVSVTVVFDGNDLGVIPSFSVRSSDGTWSDCVVADEVTKTETRRTAALSLDAADATALGIFPAIYTNVLSIDYTTRD